MAQIITIVVCLTPEIFLVPWGGSIGSIPCDGDNLQFMRHSLDTKDSSGV